MSAATTYTCDGCGAVAPGDKVVTTYGGSLNVANHHCPACWGKMRSGLMSEHDLSELQARCESLTDNLHRARADLLAQQDAGSRLLDAREQVKQYQSRVAALQAQLQDAERRTNQFAGTIEWMTPHLRRKWSEKNAGALEQVATVVYDYLRSIGHDADEEAS